MSERPTIAIAMSGGVDSSVAAALLADRGENVIGIMLRLWSDDSTNRCCSPEDMALARKIANLLDIPFYAIDAQNEFKKYVVDYFVEGYSQGITPNPCIECNRHIRWDFLYKKALSFGASYLATGHYARVTYRNGKYRLLRGIDPSKDQSYVLSILDQDRLKHSILPLGEYTKTRVREIAQSFSLPVAGRSDSQDLCFIGDGHYREFLLEQNERLSHPGPIVDSKNNFLGEHSGLSSYTIGQRKGIGVSSPHALYVLRKLPETNTLIVGPKEQLGCVEFFIDHVNWIHGESPNSDASLQVQVRYHAPEVDVSLVALGDGRFRVMLDKAVPDVTPGQFAVFYSGEECLGGGIIRA